MTNLVSKDGQQFYEIGEDFDPQTGVDKSLDAAMQKGYQRYVDVTKDGKDVFTIPATKDSIAAAMSKGYKNATQVKNEALNNADIEKKEPKMSAGQAALVGASQGLGMGWSDEIGAGMKGAFDFITQGKDPIQSTKDEYNKQQEILKKSSEDQPLARFGTEAATGLASGVGAGIGAARGAATAAPEALSFGQKVLQGAKGGAAFGAVGGAGSGDSLEERGKNALVGAGVGAGVGAAVPVAEKAYQAVKAIPAGVRTAVSQFEKQPGVAGNVMEAAKAGMAGIKTISNEDASGRTIKSLASAARERLSSNPEIASSGKNLSDLSDEQAILMDLISPGESKVKDFVAARATSIPGQRGSPDAIKDVLKMSPEDISSAQSFNKRTAAQELVDSAKEAQGSFKKNQGALFEANKTAAIAEFDKDKIKDVWGSLDPIRQEVLNNPNMSSNGQNALTYAEQVLSEGRGGSQFKINEGKGLGMVDGEEAFNRAHAARQILDDAFKQAKDNGERFSLKKARDSIDEILKSAPSMRKADTLYAQGKDLASQVFSPFMTKNKDTGRAVIDTAKLSRAFGDNDTAQRLRDALPQMKKYIADNADQIANSEQVSNFISKLEKRMGVAKTAQTIGRAESNPSGTGGKLMSQMVNKTKTGFIESLSRAPVETKRAISNFAEQYAPLFGKTSTNLNDQEKKQLIKMYMWSQQNPNSTVDQTQKAFTKFVKGEL